MTESLTYPEVGATRGPLPPGYHHVRASRVLGSGRDALGHAAERLLRFEAQRGAGLQVVASSPRAEPGTRVTLTTRVGPVRLTAPCQVVYVVDEPDRQGFAYGTLPGHPESGEELFLLELGADGRVVFSVAAFSRPARWWSRLGTPVTRLVQKAITARYLRALDPRGTA